LIRQWTIPDNQWFAQVFFSVVFGAQALGYAAPNLQCIAAARGTAYKLWDIIDKVKFD